MSFNYFAHFYQIVIKVTFKQTNYYPNLFMVLKLILIFKYNLLFDLINTSCIMIFDKNYLKPSNENAYFVYQEEQENTSFNNPYNDNPYMISSLQKIKRHLKCKKKKAVIDECLDDYKDQIVDRPQLNHVFEPNDIQAPKATIADYAKASYQKVLKDLENIQKLLDQLNTHEVRL